MSGGNFHLIRVLLDHRKLLLHLFELFRAYELPCFCKDFGSTRNLFINFLDLVLRWRRGA